MGQYDWFYAYHVQSHTIYSEKKYLPKEMSLLLIAYYRKALEKWIPSHFLFTCIDSDSVTLGVKLTERLRWGWSPLKHLTIKILLLTFLLIRNAWPNSFWEAVVCLCHFKMINKFDCIYFSLFHKGVTMEKGLYAQKCKQIFCESRSNEITVAPKLP